MYVCLFVCLCMFVCVACVHNLVWIFVSLYVYTGTRFLEYLYLDIPLLPVCKITRSDLNWRDPSPWTPGTSRLSSCPCQPYGIKAIHLCRTLTPYRVNQWEVSRVIFIISLRLQRYFSLKKTRVFRYTCIGSVVNNMSKGPSFITFSATTPWTEVFGTLDRLEE